MLVINGSPGRDKSDTMHITHAFLDRVRVLAPQEVYIIYMDNKAPAGVGHCQTVRKG